MIAKMKSSGVNNVVLFAESAMVTALTKAATGNEFSPEWTVTGFQFQDFDGFGRGADQTQFAHTFGVGTLMPLVTGTQATLGAFPWYWGTKQGTTNPTVNGWTSFIYGAIHYAGPTLTAKNVQKGLFAVPAAGGAAQGRVTFQSGYGRSVALPYDEYSALGTDKALIWWDPTAHGGANAVATIVGDGKFRYINDGKRVRYGQLPTKLPPYFDTSKAVTEISPEIAGAGVGAQRAVCRLPQQPAMSRGRGLQVGAQVLGHVGLAQRAARALHDPADGEHEDDGREEQRPSEQPHHHVVAAEHPVVDVVPEPPDRAEERGALDGRLAAGDRGELGDEGLEVVRALRVSLERGGVELASLLLALLDLLVGELALVAAEAEGGELPVELLDRGRAARGDGRGGRADDEERREREDGDREGLAADVLHRHLVCVITVSTTKMVWSNGS